MPDVTGYRQRVYVQTTTRTDDGMGGYTESAPQDGPAFLASVRSTGLRERQWASQMGWIADWTLRTRTTALTAGLRPGDLLRYGAHTLRVTRNRDIREEHREQEVLCEELHP